MLDALFDLFRRLWALFSSRSETQVQFHELETSGIAGPSSLIFPTRTRPERSPGSGSNCLSQGGVEQNPNRLQKNPEGRPGNKSNHHEGSITIPGESEGASEQRDQNNQRGKGIGPDMAGVGHQAGGTGFLALLQLMREKSQVITIVSPIPALARECGRGEFGRLR